MSDYLIAALMTREATRRKLTAPERSRPCRARRLAARALHAVARHIEPAKPATPRRA
jgi:hypothetical protein